MRSVLVPLVCLSITVPGMGSEAILHDFESEESLTAIECAATGEAAKRMPKPKLQDGQLYLLESWWKSTASAGFPRPADTGLVETVEIRFDVNMNTGTEGLGLLWLDTATHGDRGPAPEFEPWEAPSLAGCFGVGLDASNPVNRDPFRGSGNTYDRPQHEVSLHWDGMEKVKRTTPMDFRDGEPHRVVIRLTFVVGGADIDLSIDDSIVFEDFFIASMLPYAGRAALGARNSENAGDVMVDNVEFSLIGPVDSKPELPLTVMAIERQLNDKAHTKNEATVTFPENTDRFGRIICTLRLEKPETRFDPWDRLAEIYTYDDAGERIEILRYITPYHKGHEWKVDVTRFRSLLRGERKIEQMCTTYGEGWVVTVQFDFYPGPSDRQAYKIVKLWSGKAIIGNPDNPVTDFYTPKDVELDEDTSSVEIYSVVTGHGMSPNTANAAEFMPIGRTLTVNGTSHYNLLWKSDCYLNPCRPQGGTWKYDRAGWAPGDVVAPWTVQVDAPKSRTLKVEYRLDDYVNEARGETWEPFHKTEAYAIFYRSSP